MAQKHKIAEFQLGNCIGKGAFGQVYKGINLDTGEVVAIKQIDLQNVSGVELDSVMSEIELLAKLSHPNIVRYISFLKTPEKLNIILEFVEDGSLTKVLKKGKRLQEDVIARYVKQMLEGLDYLHQQGVVHCDIKCANILVSRSGVIKLTDFGVSRKLKNDEDFQNEVVGTPFWMAPEIIQLQGATTASDIWSLGCTIVELITGNPPYHELQAMAAMYKIVEDSQPELPPNISKDLEDFLRKIFQKDPKKRWTAKQLLEHPFVKSVGRKKVSPGDNAPFLKMSKKRTREDLEMAFSLLDLDKKGTVSIKDLTTLLRGLGSTWSTQELNKVFASHNVKDLANFETFVKIFESSPIQQPEPVLNAFWAFDPEGKHLISINNLRRLVTQAGDIMTSEEFNAFVSDANIDSEGNFDYDAWIAMMLK